MISRLLVLWATLKAIGRQRWPSLDAPRVRRLLMLELARRWSSYGLELARTVHERTQITLGPMVYVHLHDLEAQGLVSSWEVLGGPERGARPLRLYRLTSAGWQWLDATSCTGVAASWCPRCGDCTCERLPDGSLPDELASSGCPLHDPVSTHNEGEWRAPEVVRGG